MLDISGLVGIDAVLEPFLQLLAAMSLGMLLGAERTLAHKTAGIRTYGLVSMGACLFIITAASVLPEVSGVAGADIMRVFAGAITGIGFLGAGMIIFRENTVHGLTTAAGLWIASGIGIAVGFQQYTTAILATALTLLAFTLFWYVEERMEDYATHTDIG